MPEKVASQHDQYIKDYLIHKQERIIGKQREIEARHKDGTLFPATLRVSKLKIKGILHFTGVIDDISETKNIMAQLNQAQKMEAMGQLAAGVAHEINTPIQYIGDNLHALEANCTDLQALILKSRQKFSEFSADLQQEWNEWEEQFDIHFILQDTPLAIQQSLDGIEKVAGIVQAMKVFSHTNNQSTSFANLNEILKNTLIISKNEYKYIADIETNFASDLPDIECYGNELNQVLLNLIINAAHAIEEKKSGRGLIKITTEKQQDTLYINIQDNGTGIPKAIQDKVFNLFFTTKEVGKGSGQGLSIAHKIIVEKHQGQFYFESTEGEGTIFHIILPLSLAKTNTPLLRAMTLKNILFVDDDINVTNGMKRSLRRERDKWRTFYVISGKEALQIMGQNQIDLIVTDMLMPDMRGDELLQQVAKHYPATVRIILSGYADEATLKNAMRVAHQYLSKPCSLELLKETIAQVFKIQACIYNPLIISSVGDINQLPSLPSIYHQLKQEISNPNSTSQSIADIFTHDIALSAKLLQLVNSSYFGLNRKISNLVEAVNLIGITQVTSLVLNTFIKESFAVHNQYKTE